MGEQKKDKDWDFKVPEDGRERVRNKVKSRNPDSKNNQTLDPRTGQKDTIKKARQKLETPNQKLSIGDTQGMRKKRSSRSQLAQQYEYEDKIERLQRTPAMGRVIAGGIDIVYIGTIIFASQFLIPIAKKEYMNYLVENSINQMLPPNTLHQYIWMAIALSCFLVLYFLPTMLIGKSMGKAMKGYRIGDVVDSTSISRSKIFIREFILRPLSALSVLGVVMMFFNKKKQTLHDLILKTSVFSN